MSRSSTPVSLIDNPCVRRRPCPYVPVQEVAMVPPPSHIAVQEEVALALPSHVAVQEEVALTPPSHVAVQEEEEVALTPPSHVAVQEEVAMSPPPSHVAAQEEVAISPPPSHVPVQEYQQRPVRGRPTPLSRQELGSSVEPPRSWRDFGMAVMVAVMALVLLSVILFAPEGSQPLHDLASLVTNPRRPPDQASVATSPWSSRNHGVGGSRPEKWPASVWFLLRRLVPHRGRPPESPRGDPGALRPGRPPDLSTRKPCVWWPGWPPDWGSGGGGGRALLRIPLLPTPACVNYCLFLLFRHVWEPCL
ncbi:uncharacterized protein LOC133513324 isoform X2 [Syngnathoides biaculeatus]|uniref:uncharacterized protein LOC133513324 isoform X2 n=1 Tax=Syngnathoides biaculeatus TaxID=300417 RepID=UPI002ADDA75C|nr:uncharacterized protein LOC133513324 isoform X2 [Syngnathoides biaculeatus]